MKKLLYFNQNGEVMTSKVILSNDVTIDGNKIFADGKLFGSYNDFIYMVEATDEEVEYETLVAIRETSQFPSSFPLPSKPNVDVNIPKTGILVFNRNILINRLSNECNKKILDGFYSETAQSFLAFSEKDQSNFTQTVSLILLNGLKDKPDEIVPWKTENNGVMFFPVSHFLQIIGESEKHKKNNIANFWRIRSKIETEYTTLAQLYTIKDKTLGEL